MGKVNLYGVSAFVISYDLLSCKLADNTFLDHLLSFVLVKTLKKIAVKHNADSVFVSVIVNNFVYREFCLTLRVGAETVIFHRLVYALPKPIGDFVHIVDFTENLVSDFGVVVSEIFVIGTVYHCHKFKDKILYLFGKRLVFGGKAVPLLLVGHRLKAVVGHDFLVDFCLKALVPCIGFAVSALIVLENIFILSRSLEVVYDKFPKALSIFRRKVFDHMVHFVSRRGGQRIFSVKGNDNCVSSGILAVYNLALKLIFLGKA